MQTHKKLKARILSLALSAAMVTTMMPTTVFATEGGNIAPGASSVGEIQSFDKLDSRFDPSTGKDAPSHVYGLAVELDTSEEDLNLPTELTAMVARTTVVFAPAEDEPVVDSGKVDEPAEDETIPDADTTIPDEDEVTGEDADETVSGNQPATPSDAQEEVKEEIKDEEIPLAPEPEQDEETVITTIESESIPVKWTSDKEYKSDEKGQFIYTAQLPEGYILADGVELPQIYVMVGMQARAEKQTVCADIAASNQILDKLLTLLSEQQALVDELLEDAYASEEFKELETQSKELYDHVDACEICAKQMEEGGAYYDKFYGQDAIASEYNLTVIGVNVTDGGYWKTAANGGLEKTGNEGDYNVYWDESAHTLYLKNFKAGKRSDENDFKGGIFLRSAGKRQNIIIDIQGENELVFKGGSNNNYYMGIRAHTNGGELKVTGDGTLKASDTWCGLYSDGSIVFDGLVSCEFESTGGVEAGLAARDITARFGANVTAKGVYYGAYSNMFIVESFASITGYGQAAGIIAGSSVENVQCSDDGVNYRQAIMKSHTFDKAYNNLKTFYTIADAKEEKPMSYGRVTNEIQEVEAALLTIKANGESQKTDTTELTLRFDKEVPDLTAENITLDGAETGILTKGDKIGEYKLQITGITVADGDTVGVSISLFGYDITMPEPSTVQVYKANKKVEVLSLSQDGKKDRYSTKNLILTLNEDIASFSKEDITLQNAMMASEPIRMAKGKYLLPITGFSDGASVTVTFEKTGYEFSGAISPVTVYKVDNELLITRLSADGISGSEDTMSLGLTFNKGINGEISSANFAVSGAKVNSANRLTSATCVLIIEPETAIDGDWVQVSFDGNTENGTAIGYVQIYRAERTAKLIQAKANGVSDREATTALYLTFDAPVTGLETNDISLAGASVKSVTSLDKDAGYRYCVNINNITVENNDTVELNIVKPGYAIKLSENNIKVYKVKRDGNYIIVSIVGEGGTITPSGATTVAEGENQTYMITPDEGYKIKNVIVDGVDKGAINEYTFEDVSKDSTISAEFVEDGTKTYTITSSAGTGGSISPSGTVSVNAGANQTFTISSNSNYSISSVTVDGVNQGAISTYTFSGVTANHTISATFSYNGGGGSSSSSQTIYNSLPPNHKGGTKMIGNVRVPDYTVEGTWNKNANGSWNFAGKDGQTYANSWAPVYNPYADVTKGQSAFNWFKFDANGNMITGWHTDVDGNTYYLNPTSDNTLGAMKTGWVLIDGKYYYFNETSDGTRGKLFKNTRTPDGYLVDENGIWNGSDKQS